MQQLPLAVFLPRGVLLLFGCTPMAHQICLAQHVAAMRYLRKVWLQLNAHIGVRDCLVKAPATPDITGDPNELDMISAVVCALLQRRQARAAVAVQDMIVDIVADSMGVVLGSLYQHNESVRCLLSEASSVPPRSFLPGRFRFPAAD